MPSHSLLTSYPEFYGDIHLTAFFFSFEKNAKILGAGRFTGRMNVFVVDTRSRKLRHFNICLSRWEGITSASINKHWNWIGLNIIRMIVRKSVRHDNVVLFGIQSSLHYSNPTVGLNHFPNDIDIIKYSLCRFFHLRIIVFERQHLEIWIYWRYQRF